MGAEKADERKKKGRRSIGPWREEDRRKIMCLSINIFLNILALAFLIIFFFAVEPILDLISSG